MMNTKKLAENLGLEEEEFIEIFELFVETGNEDLENLFSAIHEGDSERAVQAAHSLKGAAANLGLAEIFEAAKKVEEMARNHLSGTLAEAALKLKREFESIARP
jgi:histidine phosphotransfer protein HptB